MKFMRIYDTLRPANSSLVVNEDFGGISLNYISRYQQIAVGTDTGEMLIYDIR